MADRNDDIKQLFSHLGLNPGDYQEIREKSRAAPRGESLMPASPAVVPPPVVVAPIIAPAPAPPATTQISPSVPVAPMPAPIEPAVMAAPATIRLQAPTVAPVAARAIVSPSAPVTADATARWSLLRAAVDTPTRVAQIERTVAAPAPVEAPLAAINDDAPTRRLFQELSRRPVDEAVDQLAEAARRRWQEAAAPPEPARASEAPLMTPPQYYPPQAIEPTAMATPEALASGELLNTFRRLVAPERVPQPKPGRLHFNYNAESTAPRAKQPREENLGDVFSRISDPRLPR